MGIRKGGGREERRMEGRKEGRKEGKEGRRKEEGKKARRQTPESFLCQTTVPDCPS